jgi:hypothetical protein
LRSSPKLAAAIKACGGGNFVPRRRFAISHAAINNFAACVRTHGYPAMPAPNFNGGAIFPSSIRTNPAFVRASQSCASLLPAGAPSRSGAPPSSTTGTNSTT